MSGASEHSYYMTEGSVVSINVGMPVEAIKGSKWKTKHRRRLLRIFVTALRHCNDIIGMLVTEVGNADYSYGKEERKRFNGLLKEAFRVADEEQGASEHNEIRTFWAKGRAVETVMVFRST